MLEACCHIVRIDLVDLETILLTFVRFPESVRPAPPKAEEALRSFELSVLLRLAMVMNFGGMVCARRTDEDRKSLQDLLNV